MTFPSALNPLRFTIMEPEEEYERGLHIQHRWRTDGTEEIRVAGSDASVLVVSLGPDHILRLKVRDRPPQGEEGADIVASTLIQRLNRSGGQWDDLRWHEGREEGTDLVAAGPHGSLKIQVTRSFTDFTSWQRLARELEMEYNTPVSLAVEHVWKAIEAKASRLGPAVRADLVLALDTTMPPIYATRAFMVALRAARAADIQTLGFRQVWLVGPTDMLTWRVDEPFPPGPWNVT